MSNAAFSPSAPPRSTVVANARFAAAGVLALWFALVVLLAADGVFVGPPGAPPLALLFAVAAPLIVFLATFRALRPFRDLVLTADLRLTTAIQAWRFAGFGFLALYAHGVLPGMFAWPAGLGDIAIGIGAPWVALAIVRRPDYAASRAFVVWNLLGILDLVVAVGTGALSSMFPAGIAGEVTTAPMAQLPLVLIPGFFVPVFLMLHFTALLQARQSAGSGHAAIGA